MSGTSRNGNGPAEYIVPGKYDVSSSPVVEQLDNVATELRNSSDRGANSLRDLGEIATHIAKLEYQANHDPITDVYNRRGFFNAVSSIDSGQRTFFSIIDIDYFKKINDTLGHPEGDRILKAVAQSLEESGTGIVCRWGGDEFALLTVVESKEIEEHGEREATVRAAVDIIAAAEAPIEQDEQWSNIPQLGISLGHSGLYMAGSLDLLGMAKEADESMYGVKNSVRKSDLR
jgi:diguanylate cyclase (GGDEF)-like protein